MSELKIDKEYLFSINEHINKICSNIKNESDRMINDDEDLFDRYLAYIKINSIVIMLGPAIKMIKNATSHGFNLSHPFFKTEEALKCGWDQARLENDPFFVHDDKIYKKPEIDLEKMEKILREILS